MVPLAISVVSFALAVIALKYIGVWDNKAWWDEANKFGILCTVASTFFAIWIFYYAQSISKRIHRRDRIPEIDLELRAKLKLIRSGLKNWDGNKNDVIDLLLQVQGLLENLQSKLSGQHKKDAKLIIQMISRKRRWYRRAKEITKEDGWDIQRDLQRFVTSLKAMHQDSEAQRL